MKAVARLADELQLALDGDRRAMARLLSAIENGAVSIESILGGTSSIESKAWSTMAITGAPGVGKSVLVDALMTRWAGQGHRVALLAVDPSSPRSGGALLGDRVRMSSVDNPEIKERACMSVPSPRALLREASPLSSKTWPPFCWLADGNVCSSRRWGQVRPSCAVQPLPTVSWSLKACQRRRDSSRKGRPA